MKNAWFPNTGISDNDVFEKHIELVLDDAAAAS